MTSYNAITVLRVENGVALTRVMALEMERRAI